MPESRESKASFLIVQEYLGPILKAEGPIGLEAIEIDATKAEAKRFPKSHPAASGLPYRIDSGCTVTRGNNNSQGPVYPPVWRTYGKKRIDYTYRGIVLDLGPLSLMIQYLTHTSAYPFPRAVYDSTIKMVDKSTRKFKVGMALIFKDHVLAFHSHDMIFQPTWASSRAALLSAPTDFYSAEWAFFAGLATWIRTRRSSSSDRHGLAIEAIREAGDVFPGVGVYTVIELFFLAGLSPQLTEAEVFDNPSRTARVGLSYRTYLHESETGPPDLIRPAIKDGLLAPTQQQRLGYINWLHVYAKDRSKIPARMAELVDDYVEKTAALSKQPEKWVRYDTPTVFDVFETSYHSTTLMLKPDLSQLIFGSQRENGLILSDPLTEYFEEQGRPLNEPTFLRPNHYLPLFLEQSEFKSLALPHRHIYTYRHVKQIWSITPAPVNSQGVDYVEDSAELTPIVGDERKRMLFSYIVKNTNMVAIGPLEYPGTGHRVSIGRATVAVPCYGDPSLPEFYTERDLKSRLLPAAASGKRRESLGDSGKAELKKELALVSAARSRKRALEEDKENEVGVVSEKPVKIKKRRMNADQRLALSLNE
ncbi:hypothetical protein R3P38DRAFT_3292361 [Favolaschia claudopus]|uniref:Uncharacterized protein n=1 Tax=Favolaschia claudopus TaxID=2862362 RepID=A0AAV9ZJJ2_9AGAR